MIVCTVRAMASARINMRLDGELWGWVAVYAKRRDATRTQIVEAALREFREACEGGVPELEQASSGSDGFAGPPTDKSLGGSGSHSPRPAAPARASALEKPHIASAREMQSPAPVGRSEWERMMRARQGRLNKGKG